MFDHFEHMMDDSFFRGTMGNFPPYNIVKTGENTYDVELALAGFGKDDIIVEYKENQLTVKSKPSKDSAEEVDKYDDGVLHRGISKRFFSKSFTIANDVEVKGAELKDGLLKVSMERIIPEHKKAKLIDIK
jgi:molecular chaperone IbpA